MRNEKDSNCFYVYVYLDPRKPGKYIYGEYEFDYEPFYVGKGKGNRFKNHLTKYLLENDNNKLKVNKINKIINNENDIIILKVNKKLSHKNAGSIEKLLIQTIGRIDLGTGCLTNLTDGGEGSYKRFMSQETKDKISKAKKGKQVAWNKGLTAKSDKRVKQYVDKHHVEYTDELRQKISKIQKELKNKEKHKMNFIKLMTSEKVKEKRIKTIMINESTKGKKNGRYNSNIDDNKMIELYNEGKTILQISRILNTNYYLIRRHLKINSII